VTGRRSSRVRARDVQISRPDKLLVPPDITKGQLAAYYERVSEPMLTQIANRPLNLERYPDGVGGERIMQQRAGRYFPDWIRRVEVPAEKGQVEHVKAGDAATLVYLAGQAAITLHPWLSRADRLDRPDRLVIDLDPSHESPDEVRRAARLFGALFSELELRPWVMSTGSRGYHVVVPLQRRLDFDAVRDFARRMAELAVLREPSLFTLEQRKAKREGRILIDVLRNAYAHTSVAAYAVRARPEAPVATPLHWDELDDRRTHPQRWTLRSVPRRIERDGDPWRNLGASASTLTQARRLLDQALAEVPATR
jgi:bifunctional non-homologous end joining protein LigD